MCRLRAAAFDAALWLALLADLVLPILLNIGGGHPKREPRMDRDHLVLAAGYNFRRLLASLAICLPSSLTRRSRKPNPPDRRLFHGRLCNGLQQ